MDVSNTSILNTLTGNVTRGRVPASDSASHAQHVDAKNAHQPISPNTDTVNISKAAHALNDEEVKAVEAIKPVAVEENTGDEKSPNTQNSKDTQNNSGNTPVTQLSEEDLKQVQELKQRDLEVRTHEAAHLAAAGKYATGGASFEYKRGPDGKSYAVGGEVGIDTSPIAGDPQATLQKAQQIRAAAQAPANPSSQDRQVAASASQMEAKARQEIAELALNGEDKPGNAQPSAKAGESKESDTSDKSASSNNTKAASAYDSVSKNDDHAAALIELVA